MTTHILDNKTDNFVKVSYAVVEILRNTATIHSMDYGDIVMIHDDSSVFGASGLENNEFIWYPCGHLQYKDTPFWMKKFINLLINEEDYNA